MYKNNGGASFELQQNAQMCVSNITEETWHQVALTPHVEEIEYLYCLVRWTFTTLTITARLFCYINVPFLLTNTGRFVMLSVIANVYNKKTKGPTLMELFATTRKLKKFFFLTTRDVRCVHHR